MGVFIRQQQFHFSPNINKFFLGYLQLIEEPLRKKKWCTSIIVALVEAPLVSPKWSELKTSLFMIAQLLFRIYMILPGAHGFSFSSNCTSSCRFVGGEVSKLLT